MMGKKFFVYILASQKKGVLYVGVTSNLVKRVWQHKSKKVVGFTQKYHVSKLVYYEEYLDVRDAILREKCLKKWRRAWKIAIIEKSNPCWKDLYFEIC